LTARAPNVYPRIWLIRHRLIAVRHIFIVCFKHFTKNILVKSDFFFWWSGFTIPMKTILVSLGGLAIGFVSGVAVSVLTLAILLGADEQKQAPKVDHKKSSEAIQRKFQRIERE
jgi:hypothetical protein